MSSTRSHSPDQQDTDDGRPHNQDDNGHLHDQDDGHPQDQDTKIRRESFSVELPVSSLNLKSTDISPNKTSTNGDESSNELVRLQLDTGRQVTWHEQGQAIIRHRLDTRTLSAENISTGNTEQQCYS